METAMNHEATAPITPPPEVQPNSDLTINDVRLETTQAFRHRLLSEANKIPSLLDTDPKVLKVILGAAKDSDSQIQTAQRMVVDTNNQQLDREMALAISRRKEQEIRSNGGANPFMRAGGVTPTEGVDHSKLPKTEIVPGELDIGASTMTYDEFIVQMEGKPT